MEMRIRFTPRCLVVPCSLLKDRGGFVKTVFSAFEKFDSALEKRMRGPCHLFVKRMLQTREEEEALIQSPCFSLQAHWAGHVREATEWFIPQTRHQRGWAAEVFPFAELKRNLLQKTQLDRLVGKSNLFNRGRTALLSCVGRRTQHLCSGSGRSTS